MLHFIFGVVTVAALLFLVLYFVPKGWKTVVANLAAGVPVLGAIVAQLASIDFTQYLDKNLALGLGLGVVVLNIILRSVTTTAVGKS